VTPLYLVPDLAQALTAQTADALARLEECSEEPAATYPVPRHEDPVC
jgi:hypothetical protein